MTTFDDPDTIEARHDIGKLTVQVRKMEAELVKRKHGDKQRPLTRRLFETLVLVLAGYDTVEIAVRRAMKVSAVSQQRVFIRQYLGVASDIELGFLAYERAWVTLELHEYA